MQNLFLSVILSVWATTVMHAQSSFFSLASSEKNVDWTVAPEAEVADNGALISLPGYHMKGTEMGAVKAVVPGVVFTSYVEAGKEPCPEYSDNIYKVDETKYNRPFWYRCEFSIDKNMCQHHSAGNRYWLLFDNTNRYAAFWVNGRKVTGTEETTRDTKGHMLRTRIDITDCVDIEGKNAIAVLITDCDQKKTRTDKGPYGTACSPSYLAAAGWDWMPYVPGRLAGIPGQVRLEVTGDVVMVDPWVRSYLPSNDEAQLTVQTELENHSNAEKQVTLRGVIMPGNISFEKTVTIKAHGSGMVKVDHTDVADLMMKNPKLWWPNGYGEPFLYKLVLGTVVDGEVTSSREIDFGIRRYDYRYIMNKVNKPVLQLLCNGTPIFIKGGNWGMSEYLLRCHGKEYETKIRLHKEMNYNMIRLWTGCVTDDEFYDYCDKYGILVWTDFWLYVSYNDVVEHDVFLVNARDKVRRLRNHASIAVWCGANECRPPHDLDKGCEMVVMEEDGNDRLYTSCSNQDAKSGSGWWKDFTPKHHFEGSWSNLAFEKPAYPYGNDYGYGFRSEIGMATFPTYESTCLFIPEKDRWPLPTDEQLKDDDNTVYNKHFFGKEAWNGGPIDYVHSVNDRYGESAGLQEFCEKAQLINLEDMKGMYEAWNDKMWNDASALLIWMSHPAYPSFVWQTYDYYYDPTGCYWGAKEACQQQHVQWNCYTNDVKVINTTANDIKRAVVKAEVFTQDGKLYDTTEKIVTDVKASNIASAFNLNLPKQYDGDVLFVRLSLSIGGDVVDTNFYWTNNKKEYDYRALNTLPEAKIKCSVGEVKDGKFIINMRNTSNCVAFANRLRLVNSKTGERILPAIMSDGYVTLMPGEERNISVEVEPELLPMQFSLLLKQYNKKEIVALKIKQ